MVIYFYFFILFILDGDTSSKHIEEVCSGCYQENFSCRCQELIENVDRINGMLLEMELLDRIAGQSITNLVQKLVRNHIHRVCQGIFDRSHLKSLESVSFYIPYFMSYVVS